MRSLRVQLAVGSALLALAAVLLVALVAVVSVAVSFDSYQSSQLKSDVNQVASTLGVDAATTSGVTPVDIGEALQRRPPGTAFGRFRFGASYIVVMTPTGKIYAPSNGDPQVSSSLARDEAATAPALRSALAGMASEGSLPDSGLVFTDHRYYAVAPIRSGNTPAGAIVGAVALVQLPRPDRAAAGGFLHDVNSVVLFGALGAALLAALIAVVFSRRLTRPLGRFHEAVASMAAGDYAARVDISSPAEYQQLAHSFNGMAAALERDVQELRRQELLRRELVANVSHELATPLTAIEGFTEALLDGVVHDPAAREDTARILAREAARLHRLVDQLRQVALFEAGAQALNRAPVNLPDLVADTLIVLSPEFEAKQLSVEQALPADLPLIYADDDRVTQILLNLLDNAVRYTPSGGRIEIDGAADGSSVRVGIANSGQGIAAEHQPRIFDRFYRADPSRSAATGGSGLGLAIVKALVEAHGGIVGIDDRPGGGVRFTFTLPFYVDPATDDASAALPADRGVQEPAPAMSSSGVDSGAVPVA